MLLARLRLPHRLWHRRLLSMSANMSPAVPTNGDPAPAGVSLKDLPKSGTFTSKLPPDPLFPTPAASAAAPRSSLGPRMVKSALYTYVTPTPSPSPPTLLAVSPAAFHTLGLAPSEASTPAFLDLVSGASSGFEDTVYPWAQCYGGWQFGQWAGQLGDGRAISLFEATNPATKQRFELQLKGAGQTPYSRFADGRAVLRSSIREFVVSEYLHAIGIPTTRALSLTLLDGVHAVRERLEPCAVVCRFAQSWVRIGTFDLCKSRGDRETLRALADYVCDEVLGIPVEPPVGQEDRNRYERMYREVVRRNAETGAKWQAAAFMNGVLNTDNISILGLSLDFGPFAFMDDFDPTYTPNHDDHHLRYSYKSQPTALWWNLTRLAESTAELFGQPFPHSPIFITSGVQSQPEADALIARAEAIIADVAESYHDTFTAEYARLMAAKLGVGQHSVAEELVAPLLDVMKEVSVDYHHFFRRLSETRGLARLGEQQEKVQLHIAASFLHTDPSPSTAAVQLLLSWLHTYSARLVAEGVEEEDRLARMRGVNPAFVPRGWVLDEVVERVEKGGDREVLGVLMEVVGKPWEDGVGGVDGERWRGEVPRGGRCGVWSCSS